MTYSAQEVVALGLATLAMLSLFQMGLQIWKLLRRRTDQAAEPTDDSAPEDAPVPPNAIVVDGSNVMYWAGGEPTAMVLGRVLADLRARGYTPLVIFDANVGYRIKNTFMSNVALARMLDLPENHVFVVNKGVVADEVILDFAQEHRLRVVSNDHFRDWALQFPLVKDKVSLIRGEWREGSVVWHDPARLKRKAA